MAAYTPPYTPPYTPAQTPAQMPAHTPPHTPPHMPPHMPPKEPYKCRTERRLERFKTANRLWSEGVPEEVRGERATCTVPYSLRRPVSSTISGEMPGKIPG